MAKEYSFPPYGEEVSKVIEKFGGKKMETYDGDDITPSVGSQGRAYSLEL